MSPYHDRTLKSYHQKGRYSLWRHWSARRKTIVAIFILMPFIALALGLGIGLSRHGGSSDDGNPSPGQQSSSSSPTGGAISTNSTTGPWWTPKNGISWQYEIYNVVNDTFPDLEVWDIDLFDNNATQIDGLHNQGRKVICYFSAGSYEDWRPDKDKFEPSDLGKNLDDWPGEKWLNTNSSNVRNIMLARLDLSVQKRCDGVDPDNVDGYDNDNGLDLTQNDAINYVSFLADAAHGRNLSLGLKNAGDIVPSVIDKVQWSVQEQCVQYKECDQFRPFIDASKPVFHVEYPKGDSTNNNDSIGSSKLKEICSNADAAGFSTLIKNMNLDAWYEACSSP